jgi:hypothetical protein
MEKFKTIPIAELKKSLDYNPETGIFLRKIDPSVRGSLRARWGNKPTSPNPNKHGYLLVSVGAVQFLAHRVAWAIHYGEWPQGQIDHINHCRSDNRISNLRVVNDAGNKKNMSLRTDNKSGCAGVSWRENRQKWRARIHVDGKEVCLGHFENKESAIAVRAKALKEYQFHKNHGNPSHDNPRNNRERPGSRRVGNAAPYPRWRGNHRWRAGIRSHVLSGRWLDCEGSMSKGLVVLAMLAFRKEQQP